MSEDRANDLPALSIRRPWLVIVINLLIVIAGIGALMGVEVRELPNIDRPIVAVRAEYPGAAPETLDAEVTRLIEGAASRVPGVYLVRSSSEEGSLRVIIEFNPGVDLVAAANDVRDAVARVERNLPEGVENLIVVKADADASPVMQLAVSSRSLAIDELSRVVEEQIEPSLISVEGVADINLFGSRERVMLVRIDPLRLAAYNLAVDDIATALPSTSMPTITDNFCMAFPLYLLVLAGLWITCLALQVVEVDMVAHVLLTGVHQWLVIPALQLAFGQRLEHQATTALAGEHLLVDRRDVPFGPRFIQKRLEQWPVFR